MLFMLILHLDLIKETELSKEEPRQNWSDGRNELAKNEFGVFLSLNNRKLSPIKNLRSRKRGLNVKIGVELNF